MIVDGKNHPQPALHTFVMLPFVVQAQENPGLARAVAKDIVRRVSQGSKRSLVMLKRYFVSSVDFSGLRFNG